MKHMNRAITVLIFIFLYLPMAVLLVASFNTGTDTILIGDVIERLFKQGNNPNLGAALSLVLMLLVFVCTGIMNKLGGEDEGVVV